MRKKQIVFFGIKIGTVLNVPILLIRLMTIGRGGGGVGC